MGDWMGWGTIGATVTLSFRDKAREFPPKKHRYTEMTTTAGGGGFKRRGEEL